MPAGDYRVSIRAPGFAPLTKSGMKLTADQDATQDFALQKSYVRMVRHLLSAGPAADAGHPRQGRLLPALHSPATDSNRAWRKIKRDEDGWRSRVSYMRDAMGYFISEPRRGFDDAKAEDVVYFLNQVFGEDSVLPRSPADMPGYQETVRNFSDEALKIVYVEYETPGPDRMPWSAHPDKDGKFWVPYYGRANKIARLDPETGKMEEFPVPNVGTAAIHSAVPAPDGSVWLTEQGSDKLGKWDPQTKEITEYPGRHGASTPIKIAPERHGVVDRRA